MTVLPQNRKLYAEVEELFSAHSIPAHDILHVIRVASLAKVIAEAEEQDTAIAEAAALLHDIGRTVQNTEENHDKAGVPRAKELLDRHSTYTDGQKEDILLAISQHSQKDSTGLLANILQDADKLDGLGAIGLVRAYISRPDLSFVHELNAKGSRNATNLSEQIAFQMEWSEMLYTKKAKELAAERYEFMNNFLQELEREIRESS